MCYESVLLHLMPNCQIATVFLLYMLTRLLAPVKGFVTKHTHAFMVPTYRDVNIYKDKVCGTHFMQII